MLLRNSEFRSNSSFDQVSELAANAVGEDSYGYRDEFLNLVTEAERLVKDNVMNEK
jgi:Ca-activated chloride channel family protein